MEAAQPLPASLENRPRATPLRMASLMVHPAAPPAVASVVKAEEKMVANMAGTWVIWVATMKITQNR